MSAEVGVVQQKMLYQEHDCVAAAASVAAFSLPLSVVYSPDLISRIAYSRDGRSPDCSKSTRSLAMSMYSSSPSQSVGIAAGADGAAQPQHWGQWSWQDRAEAGQSGAGWTAQNARQAHGSGAPWTQST